AAQRLVDRLCRRFRVAAVAVHVEGVRPHDHRGELHGIYVPGNDRGLDRITVWMRTSKRHDVVAVKTFLRTLLHEVCHHLDYQLLDLPYSFHSKGFYQRESSLLRVVARGTAHVPRRARPAAPRPVEARDRGRAAAEPERGVDRAAAQGGLDRLRAVAAAIAARQPPDQRHEGDDRQERLERPERARLAQPDQAIEPEDDEPGGRDSRKGVARPHPPRDQDRTARAPPLRPRPLPPPLP